MEFVDKAKGFLLSPTESFKSVEEDSLGDALKYSVVWFAIVGVLAAIVFTLASETMSSMPGQISGFGGANTWSNWGYALIPVVIVMVIVGGLIGLLVGGAWLHLWISVCGGRKGYTQTVKALAYGATPSYVLGWIPFLNFISGLWTLVLSILGIRELHGITTGRAVAAVLLGGIIIPAIIVGVALYYCLGSSLM